MARLGMMIGVEIDSVILTKKKSNRMSDVNFEKIVNLKQ